MGNVFSSAQALLAKHWYEKVPYTLLQTSLPAGTTTIFQVNSILQSSNQSKYAILNNIATSNNANVTLRLANDDVQQMVTSALPSNLGYIMSDIDEGMKATASFGMSLQNNSGGPIANWQLNYSVALRQLTVAEKLLRNVGTLSVYEQGLAQKFYRDAQGLRPLPVSTFLKRAFYSQVLSEQTYSFVQNASSTPQSILSKNPKNGEIYVITSIASAATLGNQVQIQIDRDDDTGYVQILADNMSLANPLSMWIPVQRIFNISVLAQVTTSNVPVYVTILRIQKSKLIRMLLGELNENSGLTGSDLTTLQQVQAGVLV